MRDGRVNGYLWECDAVDKNKVVVVVVAAVAAAAVQPNNDDDCRAKRWMKSWSWHRNFQAPSSDFAEKNQSLARPGSAAKVGLGT